jgi:hypothetical protein
MAIAGRIASTNACPKTAWAICPICARDVRRHSGWELQCRAALTGADLEAPLRRIAEARKAKELLGIPAARWVTQTVAIRYPADEESPRVAGTPRKVGAVPIGRKPMEQFVNWERYRRRT